MNMPLDWEAYAQKLEQSVRGTFWEELGAKLVSLSEDKVMISLEAEDRHLNHIGILHGGVHASLLDNVMGLAAMIARPNDRIVTTNLNVHYVAPLKKGTNYAVGEVLHLSRKIVTTQGRLYSEEGGVGSFGTGSYRLI
ncbi:PaaI family thioesterase [Paenibacillus sp. J2TS4]|uniref:PaaI family thioesterase n=1 Tax=Paenibacillus sp. J2TS4 TaxID=2807194 RepID=UPI001AFE1C63|nr:PaaI family thioesterase [Paenibacillus sp. J2TS4]GIP32760.1 hypothetical protein J2TS4_19700 [Paenibacillus sp. J2TS4]